MSGTMTKKAYLKTTKIPDEDARNQVDLFADYYELNTDMEDVSIMLDQLVHIVKMGRISVELNQEDVIDVQQHLKHTYKNGVSVLKYEEIAARHKLKARQRKRKGTKDSDISQYEARCMLVSSLTGEDLGVIESLRAADMSNMETIGALFLTV